MPEATQIPVDWQTQAVFKGDVWQCEHAGLCLAYILNMFKVSESFGYPSVPWRACHWQLVGLSVASGCLLPGGPTC